MTHRLRDAVVLLATAILVAVVPTSVTAAPVRAASEQAFSDIAGCISGADNVLVSIVVDESLSLRDTDPDDLRVRGITTAIDSLDQLAGQLDPSTDVHVSLSTFARDYSTLLGWRRLGARTADELRSVAEAKLPERDTGDATDYRQALQGAQRDLDAKQRQLRDPGACKVLLWFTDGALDVDDQTGAAASQLCQVGGIVDAVRRDGIAVVALALFRPGADVSQSQREQLRAVAEGRGSGVSCGVVPVPPQNTSGIYLPADDPGALQELFGRAGALVGGGTEVGTVTCPGPQCPGGRYSLAIDPGVAGARVLVAAREPGPPDVRLTSPSGRTVDLSAGSTEVEGATVSLIRRDGFATLDISYPRYAEDRAVWQVRPGPSELTVFWFWGAQLELQTESVSAGGRNDLRLQLLDRTGEPLPPTLYDDFRVTARLGDRRVSARVTPEGAVRGRITLGVDRLPPALPLRVSVTARSRPSGVPLGPLSLSDPLRVELPPVYPSLSPDVLDFGELEGLGTASAEIEATGSRRGPTRVCLTGSEITVPGNDPADLVTSERECVRLGPGATGSIPLQLDPGTAADGLASGDVTLRLDPADDSAPLEVDVPVELEMARVVDESTRWLLVALLVGLALLLPLLVLVLANWLTATFAMTYASRVGSAPVRITRDGLVPRDGGALISTDHFDNAGFSGRRRERRMALGHTGLTAEARGALGIRDATGVAVGPENRLLVSGMAPHRGEAANEAPMTLGDVDSAFVLVERTGTPEEADGTLVMVVPGSVVEEADIRERAVRTSDRVDWEKVLAEATPAPVTSTAATPGGSAAPAGSSGPPPPPWAGESGSTSGASPVPPAEEEREPFPWETAAGSPRPASRKSGSRGKRRFSASDSLSKDRPDDPSGRPDDQDDHADPTHRADRDGSDDLPPLPDFLRDED